LKNCYIVHPGRGPERKGAMESKKMAAQTDSLAGLRREGGSTVPSNATHLCCLVLLLSLSAAQVFAATTQYSNICGVVVDEGGAGLDNVEVRVYSGNALLLTTYTRWDGYFSLSVAYGSYDLYFSRKGYAKTSLKGVSAKDEYVNLGNVLLQRALALASSSLGIEASPGESVNVPFSVSNVGDSAEVVEFYVSAPEGLTVRILDQGGRVVTKARVSQGQTLSFQLVVDVPTTADIGSSYDLTLTTVGSTNSSLPFAITIKPPSAKVISCQFPGKVCAPGGTVRFQVRVKNPTGTDQRFSVSAGQVPFGWEASVTSASGEPVAEVSLGGGEFVDLLLSVTTPADAKEGSYYIPFVARSASTSDSLDLLVVLQVPARGIVVSAAPPYLDVYAGRQARFGIRVSNTGGYDELLSLSFNGLPADAKAWFEDASKQEITKVYVAAGQSKDFYAVVLPPEGTRLGAQGFSVRVANDDVEASVNLTFNVLALYELEIANQNFYTSFAVGGQGTYDLTLRNSGTESVTNLKVFTTGTVPDGFTVSVEPSSIQSLQPSGEATFTITLTTESSVNAGNYYIDFAASSDQTSQKPFTLRVELAHESSWLLYGGALLMVAVVGLFLVYKRFGRR